MTPPHHGGRKIRMYCSTCGAQVPDGASRCTHCGAPVSRAAGFGVPAVVHHHHHGEPLSGPVCPRCGFQGPTVGYFSQGGHVAALLFLTAITLFPVVGFGGLLYYLLRRDHRSCARCGESLGKGAMLALGSGGPNGAPLPADAAAEADLPDGGGGFGMTIGSWLFFAFALLMILGGFGEGEPAMVAIGLGAAGTGAYLVNRARKAREERRQALVVSLQQPVLRLAGQRDGRLTVTEVATTLGWPMRRAEKILNSLDDGLRVVSDVTNEGVIVYDFRELRHAQRLSANEMDALLVPSGQAPASPPLQMHAQPLPQQHTQAQPQPRDGTLQA
jgi:zinc-ribbon domain